MKFKLVESFLTEGKNVEQTIQQYIPKFAEAERNDVLFLQHRGLNETEENLYRKAITHILELDPTYTKESSTTGKYAIWLLNMATQNKEFRELLRNNDFYTISTTLSDFENKKQSIANKDINSYKSILDVKDAIADAKVSARQKERGNRNSSMIKKVWEDDIWEVWTPLNYAGSLTLGKGTNWCTADSRSAASYVQYATGEYNSSNDFKSAKDMEMHDSEDDKQEALNALNIASFEDLYKQYTEDAVVGVVPTWEYDPDCYTVYNPYNNFADKFGEKLFIFICKADKVKYQLYYDPSAEELFMANKNDVMLNDVADFVNTNKDTIPFFRDYLGLDVDIDDDIVKGVWF